MVENKFEELRKLDVNSKTEKKNGLTYLSWPFAVDEFTKAYPDWSYEIHTFPNKEGVLVPYMNDAKIGMMVETTIIAGGIEKTMWLPVMDNINNAMKEEPYEIATKYKTVQVKSATMFDVNKAIMRCLVKNMAMFGLGLYIYAGEDLPMDEEPTQVKDSKSTKETPAKLNLEEAIQSCKTNDELGALYKSNKAVICRNEKLLELVTKKGKELKGDK